MKTSKIENLKTFLDEKAVQYNQDFFIEHDPIQIPHRFSKKQDIEIAAFLSATIAWGNRKSIIKNAQDMMARMDEAPHDFILNAQEKDLDRFDGFVHRTFNAFDLAYFVQALQRLYKKEESLEQYFLIYEDEINPKFAINRFRDAFFNAEEVRTTKHVSSPLKNSSAKRINMFLRWMVRQDQQGVDFGIWKNIPASKLSLPLDVHTGNVARKLEILERKQNDWKAVEEIDSVLRQMDAEDPIKYDFALFGLGAFEGF
ncbi:TIGR02757 family protein [Weeksellaceae bacterium KMM 9713]|uniref:TIGR02757 family protein n=1 Tax=Profundicola chukchiensis TaxID=2961959 RepID=A0A9X4MYJ1_9FLAO|nr:TIGR02757 family protein [Profundicola chukchiensis]MDG4945182.1 TIGR02757 family protein [Profundicola chukchiensis]